jgi:hypothetical protein
MTANNQLKTRRQVSLGGAGDKRLPNNGSLNGSAVVLYCTLVYAAAAAKYQQLNGLAGVHRDALQSVRRADQAARACWSLSANSRNRRALVTNAFSRQLLRRGCVHRGWLGALLDVCGAA